VRNGDRRRVLVTGVGRSLGAAVCRALSEDSRAERIVGIDVRDPAGSLGRGEFVRADVRRPGLAPLLAVEAIDTVVHVGIAGRGVGPGAPSSRLAHEITIIGTLQLLAAAETTGVDRVVLRSGTAIYGSDARSPAFFREDSQRRSPARTVYERDLAEVEQYGREYAARNPGSIVTTLRLASVIGPTADTAFTRYLSLPRVPRMAGFNPRLQFIHETDAPAAFAHAAFAAMPGTFNVAAEGTITLARLLALARKGSLPVPGTLLSPAAGALGRVGALYLPPELRSLLRHGRGVDVRAMRDVLGFEPRFTTEAAVVDFLAARRDPARNEALVAQSLAAHIARVERERAIEPEAAG
jgi:UDP-glucose 4-epimerase